jgi:molecular chaperone HtpG
LIRGLGELCARSAASPEIEDYVELVYDQALLAEGSPVDDPVRLARRIADLGSRVLAPLATAARAPLGEGEG